MYRSARGPGPEEVCSSKCQPSGGQISKPPLAKLQINNALLPPGSDRSSFSQRASSLTSTRIRSLWQFDTQGVRFRSKLRFRYRTTTPLFSGSDQSLFDLSNVSTDAR